MKHILIYLLFAITSLYAEKLNKPNVILIMTDDQGYGDLGCHGNPVLKTPHLDNLYKESTRLTDFHVSSFCTPSRAALMTGRYPARTGAYRTSAGRTMLHEGEKTIANIFSDGGYSTGMVGKWHLGDNAPHRPQDRGFQDVLWHRCGGIGQASDYWGNDYFDDTYERNGKFEKFEGYCTDVWFEESISFIEKNKEKPFFLYLALNAPHGPYYVPKKWAEPYQAYKDKSSPNYVANPNFYGMIANIDHNVGILRKKLEDLSLQENTIFIFMTDNGTASGAKFNGLESEAIAGYNANLRGKKSSIYEGGHRVPFFIHWPKGQLNKGKDISTLTAHIDILPTLADLCNLEVPKTHQPDGLSLKPLLYNENPSWDRDHHVVQFHAGAHGNDLPQAFDHTCILTEKWRLVNSKKLELYDIQKDPSQRNNLAGQYPEVIKELKSKYTPFWESVSPNITPVSIDLGNPSDNPTVLCSQDWYMLKGNPPWNFHSIKRLPKITKPWKVNIQQDGQYKITLRQFPKEANKLVEAVKAKITIAGIEKETEVAKDSKGVVFNVQLKKGKTDLLTYLYNQKGEMGGAYFTEVEYLD